MLDQQMPGPGPEFFPHMDYPGVAQGAKVDRATLRIVEAVVLEDLAMLARSRKILHTTRTILRSMGVHSRNGIWRRRIISAAWILARMG